MPWIDIIWNDGPGGNVRHIAEHGITVDEVREVLQADATEHFVSRSSGLPIAAGYTAGGRFLMVVYLQIDSITVEPVTAFEPE